MSGRHVIVREIERAPEPVIDELGAAGVATAHEAAGRVGLIGPSVQPRQHGRRVAGSAVTVLSHPGDNLMIHAAIEVCRRGDILVVATTSVSTDGMFGELFATALLHRGVTAIVSDAGVRDVADLRQLDFGVWSRAVHAQGTAKATPGSVNVPVVVDGQVVHPGDVVIADDDGVFVTAAEKAPQLLDAVRRRLADEQAKRARFAAGELSVDMYGLRDKLRQLGVATVDRL